MVRELGIERAGQYYTELGGKQLSMKKNKFKGHHDLEKTDEKLNINMAGDEEKEEDLNFTATSWQHVNILHPISHCMLPQI